MRALPDGTWYCERCDLRFDSPSQCLTEKPSDFDRPLPPPKH